MVNYLKCISGMGAFLLGYLISIILEKVFPPLIEALEGFFPVSGLEGIFWMGVIIIWIMGLIVVPVGIITMGIIEENETNYLFGISGGILWFILVLLLSYFGWFMLSGLGSLLTEQVLIVIFWIGLFSVWLMLGIGVPLGSITQSSK